MNVRSNDRLRQYLNLSFALLQMATPALAPVLGIGRDIGSRSAEVQTPVVPAGYAFLIWSLIYPAVLGYAIWQCLPSQRTSPMLRSIGWWTAGALLANALWPIPVQLDTFGPASMAIILVEVACLCVALLRMRSWRPTMSPTEVALVRIPLSVFAGWVSVATFVNFAAMLRVLDLFPTGANEVPVSIAILLAAGAFAARMTLQLEGSLGYILAVIWGLIGIAVADTRQSDRPTVAATAVLLAGALAVLGTVLRRRRGR